jgi:hypothetical protein
VEVEREKLTRRIELMDGLLDPKVRTAFRQGVEGKHAQLTVRPHLAASRSATSSSR